MTTARAAAQPVPYLLRVQSFDRESIVFLPSADAVFVFLRRDGGNDAVAILPGALVVTLDDVVDVWSLAPTVVKAMLGPPAALRGAVLRASDHPALRLFAEATDARTAIALLHDLRSALSVTPDEAEFERIWRSHRLEGQPLPNADRRVQRLMRRFAGQSLSQITAVERFSATVLADRASGGHNSLGLFADGSHYARASRELTGYPPTYWRNVSLPFYDGTTARTYGGGEARTER